MYVYVHIYIYVFIMCNYVVISGRGTCNCITNICNCTARAPRSGLVYGGNMCECSKDTCYNAEFPNVSIYICGKLLTLCRIKGKERGKQINCGEFHYIKGLGIKCMGCYVTTNTYSHI